MNLTDIFTQLRAKLITFATGAEHIEEWLAKAFHSAPPAVQPVLTAATSALKQAASDSVGMADTAAKGLVDEAAPVISSAALAALTKYAGPVGGIVLTPVVNDGLDRLAAALKAEIDAAALQAKAQLAEPVTHQ